MVPCTYRESKVAPLSSGWQASRPTAFRFWSRNGGKKREKGRKIIMNISINRVPSISNEIMHGGLSSALAHRFFKRVVSVSDPSSLPLSPCTLITDGNETLEEHVYAILCRYYFKYRNKSTNCTVVMKNEQC